MKLYNTKTRKLEELEPIEVGKVRLYTCGPTVYDFAHIGNLRTYVFEDILRRGMEFDKLKINHVMNITDVDDKTIKSSQGKKADFETLTKKYEDAFFSDLKKLNIKKAETITKATDYVPKMVLFVKDLLDKGFAYKGDDGSIYYSIKKFKDYGKLSHLKIEDLKSGARVSQDEYTKENPADFALWKAWDEEDGEIYWDPSTWLRAGTELGKGRPGWHIECSTMSQDKLGETLDIHTGGVDNIFPHHENEIAQSEARTGKEFAKMWVHGEHLLVDGKKMSKSLGNFYKLSDLLKKGFSPLDFRYLALQSHYRSKLNFTWEAIEAARNSRKRLIQVVKIMKSASHPELDKGSSADSYLTKFSEKINNDLNTPEALAVLWEMVRDQKISDREKISAIEKMEDVLALDITKELFLPVEIEKLVDKHVDLRKNKDYKEADKIRDLLLSRGYEVMSTGEGVRIVEH